MRKCFALIAFVLLFAGNSWADVGPEVGQTAPDFELKSLSGDTVTLSGLRQQGYVMLVFWSTQCPVCHRMLPDFKQVHEKYDGKGFTLAAIDVGFEDQTSVEAYALQYDLNYLVLNEDDKKVELAKAYRLVGTPTIQLISPKGEVLYRGHRLPDLSHWIKPESKS
jgi:peroxiredoxin